MMLGRVAYLGSFRRRSAEMTAGRGTLMVSVPASVSRVAVMLCATVSTAGIHRINSSAVMILYLGRDVKLGGHGTLGPVEDPGDHGARLAVVTVDGLLAHDDHIGLQRAAARAGGFRGVEARTVYKRTFSLSASPAMILATASGCSSWSVRASEIMWMPLSAPMASAVRRVSVASLGPMDTATI